MNVLIAGYGGIGTAVHSLIKALPFDWINDVLIAEIKDGLSGQAAISEQKDRINMVINVTTDDDGSIRDLCRKYDIHYLDTGLDTARDIVGLLPGPDTHHSVHLLGFGMNPGLIEFMYRRERVTGKHCAIEIENDTAESGNTPFATWSPKIYYSEAMVESPFVYVDGRVADLAVNAQRPSVRLEMPDILPDGEYLWIPHEEVFSIGTGNPDCEFAGFLYCAPDFIQDLAIECRASGRVFPEVPVCHDLRGRDTVGLLLTGEAGLSRYVYNTADHWECFNRYGINGTSWQVACGVCAGLYLISHLAPGSYTMSTLPDDCFSLIERCLDRLDFTIHRRDLRLPPDLADLSVDLIDGRRIACCG